MMVIILYTITLRKSGNIERERAPRMVSAESL